MAMPATPSAEWTAELVHQLPDDGNRYEVIDGELYVTPAPSIAHQRVLAGLFRILQLYAEEAGLEVLFAPVAIRFSDRREVEPDLVGWPRMAGGEVPDFRAPGSLALAIEVLSPTTARVDRHRKRALYQQQQVSEYWIVDAANRLIERWRPVDVEPEVALEYMEWQPRADVAPLHIDLARLFDEVHGGGMATP